jgi:hypothetical protein
MINRHSSPDAIRRHSEDAIARGLELLDRGVPWPEDEASGGESAPFGRSLKGLEVQYDEVLCGRVCRSRGRSLMEVISAALQLGQSGT